jgi:hypothetical protein
MATPLINIDTAVMTCCERPDVVVMDYLKYTPDRWSQPQPRINRLCFRCMTHWVGRPNRVRKYRGPEWDALLNAGVAVDAARSKLAGKDY